MPRDFDDVELAVVLNEYSFVREQRRNNRDGSNARFNYFLVVATGGTALVAGTLGVPGGVTVPRIAAAGVMGALVLVIGLLVFVRLVHYRLSDIEHCYHLNALRTYLLRRAPSVRSFVLLPTFDDEESSLPLSARARGWAGLAQTVGVVNSVLIGTAVAVAGCYLRFPGAPWWVPAAVAAGAVAAGVSLLLHRRYEQRILAVASLSIDHRTRKRVRTPVVPTPWPGPREEIGTEIALRGFEYR